MTLNQHKHKKKRKNRHRHIDNPMWHDGQRYSRLVDGYTASLPYPNLNHVTNVMLRKSGRKLRGLHKH